MYGRRRKCLVVGLAVGFLLLSFSTYIIPNGDGTVQWEAGFKDVFENDHIDIPEIPVGKKALNDSDYEELYRKGMTVRKIKQSKRSKLFWHNDIKNLPVVIQQPENKITQVETDTLKTISQKEFERFQEQFRNWPKTKPKAAFYVLASRVVLLRRMLESVDKYFNDKFHYPVIVFHEARFSKLIPQVRSFTNSTLFFQLITFEIPSFLTQPVKENIPCLSKITYRHMCRFNAKLVYEEPTMKELDYYWRLDDDSLLLSPVSYDVFVYMRDKDIHYGYSWMFFDSSSCVIGLWEATDRYIKEHDIQPTFFKDWPQPRLYYNNFEISSTKLWLSQEFKDYIEYLDKLGGMYYHRWGDAPIHGIAIALFLQKNQIHEFIDIGYQHNTYIHHANIPNMR